MISLGDGRWAGTWTPLTEGRVNVTIVAKRSPADPGEAGFQAVVLSNDLAPRINFDGAGSVAGIGVAGVLAPGAVFSIRGTALALTPLRVSGTSLPNSLGDTSVLLNGRPIPLISVSPAEIQAQVPWDAPADARLDLSVIRGGWISPPLTVLSAAARPEVLRSGEEALIVNTEGRSISGTNPARAGEMVTISAAGLGQVSPRIPSGSVPAESSRAPSPECIVRLMVGDTEAEVISATLSSSFAGVYEVSARLPQELASGSIPARLRCGNAQSSEFRIPVR
jgi:uncharacterized protein (TIGR03437 family)